MRLINVKIFKFEEFLDHEPPPYAILSHTWGDACEELTVRDVQAGKIDKPGVGSVKFWGSCRQAGNDGLEYIWIDTCCIEKDSSAELDEAIRSMFRWYRRASVCYAYLSDVTSNDDPQECESKFRFSRWFRRGWTLQELLAPETVQFYDSNWKSLGNKGGMSTIIAEITGIPQRILLGIVELDTASVAQRMSWAARRDTKRKEDLAYCLLGIFDVSMPIMYGEGGDQAFFRLQDHIIKKTRDDSILAWGLSSDGEQSNSDPGQVTPGRILAAAPSDFANSGHIISRDQPADPTNSFEISGVSLRLHLSLLTTPTGNVFGLLNCSPEHDTARLVGIPLAEVMSAVTDEYVRPEGYSARQLRVALRSPPTLIHIKNHGKIRNTADQNKHYWFYNDHELSKANLKLAGVTPESCWRPGRSVIECATSHCDSASPQILARLRHNDDGSLDFVIALGLTRQGTRANSDCFVMICSRDLPLEELARKLRYVLRKASGKSRASNGLTHLQVDLVPDARHPFFTIKTEILSHPPSVTVNASVELQKSQLIPETVLIYRKMQRNIALAKNQGNQLQLVTREQQKVEDELRRLEERRRKLIEKKDNAAHEICRLKEEQMKTEEIREQISELSSHFQKRFRELHQIDENEKGYGVEIADGNRWTVENGLVEIAEMLLNEDGNGAGVIPGVLPPTSPSSVRAIVETIMAVVIPGILRPTTSSSVQAIIEIIKANADAKDVNYGHTLLICAAANGCEIVARLLLSTGKVGVNSKDNDGRTPLSWATEKGHGNVVRLLLERGADIDIRDKDTHTALSYATRGSHKDIVNLLQRRTTDKISVTDVLVVVVLVVVVLVVIALISVWDN
ncbi:hypothetical protein F5X97DRAFT_340069 [Nemania serpens]|nr:hypothetical protein F5X97DRAFT_340069 [Nemania serpens]